jgi:UDP-glucose:(heptosyl)LPS alpha-1,3-glucosyltransferase
MVKEQIIDTYNINPKKINIIYNGIELKEMDYKKSYDKLSKEFSISKNQYILLFVGSGFKRKGAVEFLQIISKLKTKDIKAFIIGKEKNIKYYKNLSKKLNIDNQVVFTGPRSDVDDFYSISDIFLFPTHYDPFSNVVLEAMNFENVVFTTKKNGASEILDKDFIMDKSYDTGVISSIDNLLNNKAALDKEKIKNKKLSKLFSIEKNLNTTLEVISQIEKK